MTGVLSRIEMGVEVEKAMEEKGGASFKAVAINT